MSVSPMFRSRERGPTRMRENAKQRAARIELGASGSALGGGSMDFAEGQRFMTAGRTITPAAIAFVEGPDSRYGDTAPAGLFLGYALGLLPLVDERIVAVRPRGEVSFGRAARVGDAIHVEGRIDEVKALDDESDIVRMTCDVLNQRREQIGHIEVDALMDHGCRPGAACREQDYVKRESATAVPA